jgi:hypothetical protein
MVGAIGGGRSARRRREVEHGQDARLREQQARALQRGKLDSAKAALGDPDVGQRALAVGLAALAARVDIRLLRGCAGLLVLAIELFFRRQPRSLDFASPRLRAS